MKATANSDMSEFWNGEGGRKWVRFQDMMDASLLPFGQAAMAAADVSAGDRVIDVGCGCGATSFELARRVGPGGHVRGIDISEPIVAQARRRVPAEVLKTLDFECADVQGHRFQRAAFDLVFSRFGVMFFDDPAAAFGKLGHALVAGGRVAFTCWRPAERNEWVSKSLDVVARHVPLPEPLDPEAPGPFSFGDSARVFRILSKAGFTDVVADSFRTDFIIGHDLGAAVEFLMQMGPASAAIAQADADEATRERIAVDLRGMLTAYKKETGVAMAAEAWIVTARKS